nr:GRAM domain-containing protein 4-like isoform X1 [Pocillopora verrucosa]
MLRSAFRGKQTTDSTKNENRGKTSHGRSHSFFHRDGGHEDAKNTNGDHENLNALVAETVGCSTHGEVLTTDFSHEFLESTHSSSSDKESLDEEDGSAKPTLHEIHGGKGNCDQKVTPNRGEFSSSEREIYETQLAQLQEQLVNTMIDYQDMSVQLEKLKAVDVQKLQKEIQEERAKNNELREKLKQKQKSSSSKLHRKNANRIDPRSKSGHQGTDPERDQGDDWVYLGGEDESHTLSHVTNGSQGTHPEENQESCEVLNSSHARDQLEEQAAVESVDGDGQKVQRFKTKLEMWKAKVIDILGDRLWDFVNDEPEDTNEEDGEGDPLAIKTLKENINRFSTGIKPITGFIKSVGKVLTWSNPTASFLIFVVYMYSVWYGYLLSLILFTMIWKLFMNYLHAKGIARYLGFTDELKEEAGASEDHSWSDKFQLVLQVARKVQNTLGKMANSLEKIKNLLTWQHPLATRKLFTVLNIAFVASLGLRGPTLFTLLGLSFGVKLFIVNPIYHRFPKVKRRYDGTAKLWEELPTEADLVASRYSVDGNQEILGRSTSATSSSSPSSSSSHHQIGPHSNPVAEKFRLPSSEIVLPGWEEGKRCALLDKDKPFSSVKHGKLFLTQSYLCFEKTRSSSGKHIVIKLDTIISLSKAKPIAIMPGTGMALEVNVRGLDKPYIFGGIIGRDDVFESIRATGRTGNFPWVQMAPSTL